MFVLEEITHDWENVEKKKFGIVFLNKENGFFVQVVEQVIFVLLVKAKLKCRG